MDAVDCIVWWVNILAWKRSNICAHVTQYQCSCSWFCVSSFSSVFFWNMYWLQCFKSLWCEFFFFACTTDTILPWHLVLFLCSFFSFLRVKIVKISFKSKQFFIQLRKETVSNQMCVRFVPVFYVCWEISKRSGSFGLDLAARGPSREGTKPTQVRLIMQSVLSVYDMTIHNWCRPLHIWIFILRVEVVEWIFYLRLDHLKLLENVGLFGRPCAVNTHVHSLNINAACVWERSTVLYMVQ